MCITTHTHVKHTNDPAYTMSCCQCDRSDWLIISLSCSQSVCRIGWRKKKRPSNVMQVACGYPKSLHNVHTEETKKKLSYTCINISPCSVFSVLHTNIRTTYQTSKPLNLECVVRVACPRAEGANMINVWPKLDAIFTPQWLIIVSHK